MITEKMTTMFEKHMLDLLEAIEDSYAKSRIMPCLVLLYSGIDVVASLEPSQGIQVGDRFKKWVEGYMLRYLKNCTANDLYGARCAVVHTFTPDSNLSRTGKARVVAYAIGSAELSDLEEASAIAGQSEQVNVHIRDLIDAFRNGFADFLEQIRTDKTRFKEVQKSAGMWAVWTDPKKIQDYIAVSRGGINI
jgi:hypothetical protein